MKRMIMVLAIIFINIYPCFIVSAESNDILKAAFIKENDLWIKIDNNEKRITNGEYIRFPKWSFDGNWIAYIKETKENEYSNQGELWVYDVKKEKKYKAFSKVSENFSWSPNQNTIGFQSDDILMMAEVKLLHQPQKVTSGIINFSWFPDGNGFLTSSKAGKDVFSDILLSKILIKDNHKIESQHFYTIPVGKNDHFYGTSQFKWSFDNKWISFLLVPTASMSADSNTISVLSSDGQKFYKIDEMLNYGEWFQWAPSDNFLAFIKGSNRVSTLNKKLEMKDMMKNKTSILTSTGFVDRDFTWISNNKFFVSRSVENDFFVNPDKRPQPSIYLVDLITKKERQITSPSPFPNEGDFYPMSINNGKGLMWIRTHKDYANVWTATIEGMNPKTWIAKMDLGSWYYEHWNWDEVFSLYQPKEKRILMGRRS